MIKRIEINNIQSHKHTEIDFTQGVNSIVGESCSGKTAVLRSIYWVIYNKPLGLDILCSKWNKTDKGKLKGEMSVTIHTEMGWVKRYRNPESNGYVIHYNDGKEVKLEAVKTDVPEEVSKFLNISDINVQRQMDKPFLLSDSAPESARFLNNLVHLDLIDITLSKAEHNKRENNSLIKHLDESLQQNKIALDSLSFVSDAEDLLSRIDKIDDEISELDEEERVLEDEVGHFVELVDYSEASDLVKEIESIETFVTTEETVLRGQIEQMESIKELPDYSLAQELVNRIENIQLPDDSELRLQIETMKRNVDVQKQCQEKIKELQKELPDVCPLCGKPMEVCND